MVQHSKFAMILGKCSRVPPTPHYGAICGEVLKHCETYRVEFSFICLQFKDFPHLTFHVNIVGVRLI
jgi:hypothetical protein